MRHGCFLSPRSASPHLVTVLMCISLSRGKRAQVRRETVGDGGEVEWSTLWDSAGSGSNGADAGPRFGPNTEPGEVRAAPTLDRLLADTLLRDGFVGLPSESPRSVAHQ